MLSLGRGRDVLCLTLGVCSGTVQIECAPCLVLVDGGFFFDLRLDVEVRLHVLSACWAERGEVRWGSYRSAHARWPALVVWTRGMFQNVLSGRCTRGSLAERLGAAGLQLLSMTRCRPPEDPPSTPLHLPPRSQQRSRFSPVPGLCVSGPGTSPLQNLPSWAVLSQGKRRKIS